MKLIKKYALMTAGCAVYAAGFAFFIEPANLAPGGASGIAVIIVHYLQSLDCGTVIFLLNLPLLLIGTFVFGAEFCFGTVYATAVSSVMITLLESTSIIPFDPSKRLTCALLGAVFIGIGVGVIFACGATTGGTDIVVKLIGRKSKNLPTGHIFMLVDSTVVIISGFVFRDIMTVVYSAISLILCSITINAVIYKNPRGNPTE